MNLNNISPDIIKLFDDNEFLEWAAIRHWNKAPRQNHCSLPEHSWWVTLFSRLLSESLGLDTQTKLSISDYAIVHDLPEMFTGDLNSLFKHNPYNGKEISKLVNEFETCRLSTKFRELSSSSQDYFIVSICQISDPGNVGALIKRVVKCADNLSLLWFCNREVKMGNKLFEKQYWECVELSVNSFESLKSLLSAPMDEFPELCIKNNINLINEYLYYFKNLRNESKN